MDYPIYNVVLDDEIGLTAVSLVNLPAVEKDFIYFSKEKEPMNFTIQDEEQHKVFGVILRADYPILRISNGQKYYINFTKEVIEQFALKMMGTGTFNLVDLMHDHDSFVDCVKPLYFFVKDSERGISPKGFEDVSEGSLFGVFKIENDLLWNEVKNGTFKGFSAEILVDGLEPVEEEEEDEKEAVEIEELLSKITKKINKIKK